MLADSENSGKTREYLLKPGDELTITVLDEKELSGKYRINTQGEIVMPLIGKVTAKDLTIKQLEARITDALQPDYLINARVSIQVLNFPPYYIMGEVASSGSFPYVSGMTYLNAVAIAGGFTYRAVKDYVYVIRANDPEKEEQKLGVDELVMPGDVIRVDERFF
ncbi:MAG: polysaccharide biosynthesis/export family protein [Gammaproteobacteria bacterium]